MINTSTAYIPIAQTCERSLSDLAFGIRSVERVASATPEEIVRLDHLLNALSEAITKLERKDK